MDNVLLTFEQFDEINTGLEIREDGMTNKKCHKGDLYVF